MGKRKSGKKKTKKTVSVKNSIHELSASRDGGQVALRGYSYQFLYSCYLILLSADAKTSFRLEGIEDIDEIHYAESGHDILHIQLKYSVNRQNASFLPTILTNFLEAYLLDPHRQFKLVYDFPVADGHMRKLFQSNLDCASCSHWQGVIEKIKSDCPDWNWSAYDFDDFMSKLSFEHVEKSSLEEGIEKALVKIYDITTDNVSLFANSLKVFCLDKMEKRAYITKAEIDKRILAVKDDISKGPQNPAHRWIRRLNYSVPSTNPDLGFYEGKKASPTDIASGLPIHRPELEAEIEKSINNFEVTVIKASSGQGKTTLALQAAYHLRNDYTPYLLIWCDDIQETGNTVQYFKTRIQLGEKVLIIIDNLDAHFKNWTDLVQQMQFELADHYRVLITSRETDWYNYSGDISNIRSIHIIKPVLTENEAVAIFNMFKAANRLHPSITRWQNAWSRIADRQLLIEYVYLLTHGEMLAERISAQMSEIGQSHAGKAKFEILRKVCFADACGIRLSVRKLLDSLEEPTDEDCGELLKSMQDEFLVHIDADGGYIEGLHPIRSRHVVDRLHEFLPVDDTALAVIAVAEDADMAVFFSHLPEFNVTRDEFSARAVDTLWHDEDLSICLAAIQGLFSGSVMQYYFAQKDKFDDANRHGGLHIIATEVCPFACFPEFNVSVDTLDNLRENMPENKNIQYLCNLRDNIPACNLQETYVYSFSRKLYEKLLEIKFADIRDIKSYAAIAEWLYDIDPTFNLSVNFSLEDLWTNAENFALDSISSLMYCSFCGSREKYMHFVEENLETILIYIKHRIDSQKLYLEPERKAIHTEYILRLRDIKKANNESVSRLKVICKILPIFDTYCADAIMPKLNMLSAHQIPNDSHKEMPIRNIVIMFHQNLTSLWLKTIMSNYESGTVAEWIEYWLCVRKLICRLADKCCSVMHKLLAGRPLGELGTEIDELRSELTQQIVREVRYPREDRPFQAKAMLPEGLGKIKSEFFHSMDNFSRQFPEFLRKDSENQRLALINIKIANSSLKNMQQFFYYICHNTAYQKVHEELCTTEQQKINSLLINCNYYMNHSASKYFNKYQVTAWNEANSKRELETVEEGLAPLCADFSVHFPKTTYSMGLLRCYPIIADGLDATSGDDLAKLFLDSISFADSPFEYMVVLFSDKPGRVEPSALRLPRQFFRDVKAESESKDENQFQNLSAPFPENVTEQMLDCFPQKYELSVKRDPAPENSQIGDVAEELWVYSKLNELLTAPEDKGFLSTSLNQVRANVSATIETLEGSMPTEHIHRLKDECKAVFSGQLFDNDNLNKFVYGCMAQEAST